MAKPPPISAPLKPRRAPALAGGRRKPGPAPHQPTAASRTDVKVAVAAGQSHAQIARMMGMGESTLRDHYRAELDVGADELERGIARTMASIALDRNHPKCVLAQIFMLKTRFKWREEGGPPPGGAQQLQVESAGPARFTIRIGDRPAPAAAVEADPDDD